MKTAALDECVNVANVSDPITAAELGVTLQAAADGGLPTGDVVFDNYSAGTQGVIKVDFATPITDDVELELTVIDVTDGREKFPRRTFTGTTLAELISNSNGKEILAGDGFSIAVAATSGSTTAVDVTMPAGRLLRVAATDGAAITTSTAAVLPTGYTLPEATEYAKDFMAHQYGRTNRVGFPVKEPAALTTAIGSTGTYDLMVITKVSDVKFDKNQGNSYQDVETFHFLVLSSVISAAGTTAITDS